MISKITSLVRALSPALTSFVLILLTNQVDLSASISPHCNYLLGKLGTRNYLPASPSWSPFKIFTRSRSTEITAGLPVEATPQQDDLRLSGPPSGQGADCSTPSRVRRVPADLRED
ncbi:hypothetical protein PoB_000240700 [Plakobranchus ocellatus]|uniref:Secreted protein n=1 Tax=Plakobranchus ocellatus TaxID=259542 RepID=A0AAV3XZI3_9GAST|nr:hypothetical protein PoB_000240700 [Plakobranchus ocellatus]